MMELKGKRIVLGVTGGIAAYKAAELLRLLVKAGAEVRVAMTEGATHFVTATTFQALSGQPVFSDQWDARMANAMAHIDLSREADLLIVAPASADFLARVANGLADSLLTTMTLARACPLLVAPAMNRQMWENPATRRNVARLQADGIGLIGPACGEQACGELGVGRMAEPAEILDAVAAFFTPKRLAGKKVLLTAGPTFEAIDAVRGITNLSSGRMGYALARAARHAGAEVTLVSGPVALPTPAGVERIDARSALEMQAAVMPRAAASDIFIAVAAVAEYRVAQVAGHKLKKDAGGIPALELVENPDILAAVAGLENGPFCVGFAAESHDLEKHAQAKRQKKKVPLLVGNLIADGLGGETNRLVLFDDRGIHHLPPASKTALARQLIEHIADLTGADDAPD
ncbi:MAG: bifunctional phosphopantothenoylcysteine decarboxylase/phosphopantothenate--cysteine ligase CoaBC [Azonexus sp.]|jgi:phosphopantothenoylcysteine decarboxylase/phosphopantothenate--cysteine ligase|nr:bifunctional phosphopantothenoylcysteine decarboxylase/phosphopantothenate--cysteine ligase CoaBC [Azonexus sp.]